MKIEVSRYYLDKCTRFADEQLETSKHLYAYRGESRIDKIREDIIVGKLGECAAYQYLDYLGFKVSRPDFKIYKGRRKSFDADFSCENGLFHVKSQSEVSRKRYGASWLVQRKDPMLQNPEENEYFLFITVSGRECEILGLVPVADIVDNGLLEECRVPSYRHTKYALYFENIEKKLLGD